VAKTAKGAAREALPTRRTTRSGVTRRAVFLGLVVVPLNVWWVTLTEGKWHSLDGSWGPIFATPVFILLCLVALNLAVTRMRPKWALSQQELLVVYIMLVVSESMNGYHTLQSLMGTVTHPLFYATPENQWQSLFFRYLPRWLFVTDQTALDGFYYGGESMYHWRFLSGWVVPLAAWSFFMLVLVWVMICLNVMVRKQWTEQEKLTYPVIQLPLALADEKGAKELLGNRVMWLGLGLAFSIGLINGLNFLYPTIPRVPGIRLFSVMPYFTRWPLSAVDTFDISMYPFMIGLAFFLPSDLAFSCWFFYLFMKGEQIGGAAFGWRDLPGFPFFDQQASGALIALASAALWGTRHQLKNVFAKAFRLDSSVDDAGEPLPYRWAVGGLFAGLGVLSIISRLAGMSLWATVFFFTVYFLVAIVISRVRAEFGAPHVIRSGNPQQVMVLIGTKHFSAPTLTVMGCYWWFNRGYASHPMPNQLEAFKMAQVTGMDGRSLVWIMLLASVVAMFFTYWSHLNVFYQDGALVSPGYRSWVGDESFRRIATWIKTPTGADVRGIVAVAVVSVFTLLLRTGRTRFFNWPFHPAGYALAVSGALKYTWFCFFIAWLAKSILTYVGGNAFRRAATPFFMGLMLGDFTAGIMWSSLGAVLGRPMYKTFFIP